MPAYLVQPKGEGYAFRLAIPRALRGRFPSRNGRPRRQIIEGLGTDSRKEAERLAAKRLAHWQSIFDRASRDMPFTLAEIQDAATEVYRSTVSQLSGVADAMADLIGSEREWLQSLARVTGQALADDNFKLATAHIEAVERRHGVTIEQGSPTYAALARALLRAQIAATEGRLRLLDGKPSDMPATFLGADGIDPTTLKPVALQRPVTRLKTEHGPWSLFEQWVAEAKPAAATINRWRSVFLNLQAKFGANEVTADAAHAWARGLVTNARSAKTVREVWVNGARTVYNWAVEQKRANSNPFAAIKITVPEAIETRESKAFTQQEATIILRAALAVEPNGRAFNAAQRWVPWLQSYSGARAGEITQLRGQDVMQQDGIWMMKLTPDAGTVKTRRPRVVPLHEHIIAQGFLDFVKANGSGPLFYNGGEKTRKDAKEDEATNPRRPRAVKTRERLAAWVRELGVTDVDVSPTHGWRHLFKQIAEGAGISERMSDYITGHAPATIGRKYGTPQVADLAAALAKFPRYGE